MSKENNDLDNDQDKEFVAKYKAALRAKLSREEFAAYQEVLPNSIVRRRLSISTRTGLDLVLLESDSEFDGAVDLEKIEKFEKYYKEILDSHHGPQTMDYSSSNKKQVYIITAAQNATRIHQGFFSALLQYKEYRNAELIVIPYRYRNPASVWMGADKKSDWWWEPLRPFILENQVKLCDGLEIMGQIKMQPTATTPLSGLDTITGVNSAVFGHPKIQLKTVPTPQSKLPKILTTTGSCTEENYTDTKTGHKGKFHHNISALIVEVDGDKFHMRHVHGDEDGSFYDLEYYYTPRSRSKYGRVIGLIPGDIHAEFIDKKVESALFTGPDSIVGVLDPKFHVYHDIEDFYARNHHHKNNDVIAYGKHHYGRNNVQDGLQISADFIDRHTRPNMFNYIPRPNHDEAFDRWLQEGDPKLDPENARFYHYMKFNQYGHVEMTDTGFSTFNAFEWWCKNPLNKKGLQAIEQTKFLQRDQHLFIGGIEIELGFHGDQGNNGGRGSINSFAKIGPKSVIGHSHSPGIVEGVYQVGVTGRLDLEYASGPSSWMHTHCIIYPNGSRALINVVGGEWRASYYDKEHDITS